VREDTLQLFGFRTLREKEMFLQLTSVSGIGPKLAITLLSGMPADELIPAIRTNNLAKLTGIPGIGKKTAERLVIELRDRMAKMSGPDTEQTFPTTPLAAGYEAVRDDTVEALLTLGYQKAQAEKIVARVLQQETNHSIEHILRQSLKQLSR
jgi:Holliday junction DNA helicase RuvA